MKVEVKLFAYFRDGRFARELKNYPENITVRQIIEGLEIDPKEVGVTMINGRHCLPDATIHENDVLGIFPMIGGG